MQLDRTSWKRGDAQNGCAVRKIADLVLELVLVVDANILYLREKNDLMQKWKMEEMQLQKQRLEAESKKEEQSKKQHQDLMQVMLQQSKQQQEQMQNFQQMFTLMQQQQSQIIVKLLEKQN